MSVDKFNSEGYYDPTAYEAMSTVEKEERALRAFRPIVYICSPRDTAALRWKKATSP